MRYTDIHTALVNAAKTGQLKSIIETDFESHGIFSFDNSAQIDAWLFSVSDDRGAVKDSDGLNISRIRDAVQEYCTQFINQNYYKKTFSNGYSAVQYLEQCEFENDYESKEEFDASANIFDGLANFEYFDMAMKSVMVRFKN
jgi:hypothetical protein